VAEAVARVAGISAANTQAAERTATFSEEQLMSVEAVTVNAQELVGMGERLLKVLQAP
jgi:hypothetical protein